MSKNKDLYIFIKDEDTSTFGVTGPIPHHTVNEWIDVELAARKLGRRVSVFDHFEEHLEAVVKDIVQRNFKMVAPEKIIHLPKDRSAEYTGLLTTFAQNADRDRVVSLICKGRCRTSSWAELNAIYPGQEDLKKAPSGKFTAKCLRCGTVASDHYNWTR